MVSIKEVAEACKVSTATVSKALNYHSDIGKDTADRIRSIAEEMGYVPNIGAKILRAGTAAYPLGSDVNFSKEPNGTYVIRRETEEDHFAVEALLKRVFWNLQVPGCNEHYYPHIMRKHEDYIPELNLIIEGKDIGIIGSIFAVKSKMYDETGTEKTVLTLCLFGVELKYQRKGYGTALLEKVFELGKAMGYDTVLLYGNPDNYVNRGFKSCLKYKVHIPGNIYPAALLVKELKKDALAGHTWEYHESKSFDVDLSGFEEFDKKHEQMKPAYKPSQEEFFIHSHSIMDV